MMLRDQKWAWDSGFCLRMRDAREKAGLTQGEAAVALGTCAAYIHKVEYAKTVPHIARVCDMADLYGVSIDWLCGRECK